MLIDAENVSHQQITVIRRTVDTLGHAVAWRRFGHFSRPKSLGVGFRRTCRRKSSSVTPLSTLGSLLKAAALNFIPRSTDAPR